MKIIDSNKDFYDFYQNIYRDSSIVFDRRDSYNLSKKEFASYFKIKESAYNIIKSTKIFSCYKNNNDWIILRVGYKFWLINLEIIKSNEFGECIDYSLTLEYSWEDYNKEYEEVIEICIIKFWLHIRDTIEDRIKGINNGDYKVFKKLNEFLLYTSTKEDNWAYKIKHIPILQNIGIAGIINGLEIYLAIEEFLSRKITVNERSESIGLTNDEKVTNHGFDLQKSFRNIK